MTYSKNIRPHVSDEIRQSKTHAREGNMTRAFEHLERAHVLAQASPSQHLRSHCYMLGWAIKMLSSREVLGQLLRITGSLSQFVTHYYPPGNTGGSNISPFQQLPIADDLQQIINSANTLS